MSRKRGSPDHRALSQISFLIQTAGGDEFDSTKELDLHSTVDLLA